MRHPDEGTIHAWLDGALPAGEARELEAHVAGCADCATATAEARGLLAASSRILSALDAVPGGVLPEAAPMTSGARAAVRRRTVRRALRVPNGVWRAAATITVLAAGAWLAERTTRSHRAVPELTTVAYLDTTSFRIPGVVVDAPPARPSTERYDVAAAAPRQEVSASTATTSPPPNDAAGDAFGRAASGNTRARAGGAPPGPLVASAPAHVLADTAAASDARDALAQQAASTERRAAASADEPLRKAARAEEPATRLVIDRAYVDSVLAADSLTAVEGRPSGGLLAQSRVGQVYSPSAGAAPTAPPAAVPSARALKARVDSPVARAAGCWTMDTSAWSPRFRGSGESLLPPRVELRAERGVMGDEWGELVLRPAPGESAFPAGTAATWKPIGRDAIRLTIGDSTRWEVTTLTIDGDSLSGRVRAYEGAGKRIRTAEVRGRRVVCRTEP